MVRIMELGLSPQFNSNLFTNPNYIWNYSDGLAGSLIRISNPSVELRASIIPSCLSMIFFVMVSPNPDPASRNRFAR